MALRRFTRSIDGTIPVQALLYNDEELYSNQEGVGIYDGQQKSPKHQSGSVFITTHRLFYIDADHPFKHSFSLDLSQIKQTDYYAGLFKSSPKITLHLSADGVPLNQDSNGEAEPGFESWVCEVCAYRNPPGWSPAAARICGLCGVPRSTVSDLSSSMSNIRISSSLPSMSAVLASPPASSPSPPDAESDSIACPACTFLNHPSLRFCEICSTELPRRDGVSSRRMRSAPSSRPRSPDIDEDEDDGESSMLRVVKISFRKGGDKAFYAVLKRSLQGKLWEANGITSQSSNPRNEVESSDRNIASKSGIGGILQNIETTEQEREAGMKNALQDLEFLMIKAKDMVRLAAELNDKLTAASRSAATPASTSSALSSGLSPPSSSMEPEEATFIRSSLSQLGMQMPNAPVTQDMMKSERLWYEELAKELAQVLQGLPGKWNEGGLMKTRGMIALDEAWGGWNRARGVALIPPSTFLNVIPLLPMYTNPALELRTFQSGLRVLHTPPYSNTAFAARLSSTLAASGPKTTLEIAMEERMTVGLSAEMIAAVEAEGGICRDDSDAAIVGGSSGGGGTDLKWWSNVFAGYAYDGQD